MKGDIGDGQCGTGADDCEHAGIALRIRRQHHGDDLRLVAITLREKRADGTIDQPAGKNLFFGRAALALNEPSGEFSRSIVVFAVIHRKGEEASSWLWLRRGTSGD